MKTNHPLIPAEKIITEGVLVGAIRCSGLILGVGAALAFGQAHKFHKDFTNVPISYAAPYVEQFICPDSGKLTEVYPWGYTVTGGSKFSLRFILPSGRIFEQVMGAPWVPWDPFYGEESGGRWTMQGTESNSVTAPYRLNASITFTSQRRARTDLPITGIGVSSLSKVDSIILKWLRVNEFEAATAAIMKNKRLVFSHGYGWQDYNRTTPISPATVMRIASNTKPVTATAIRTLIAGGQLSLDSKVYDVLAIPPLSGQSIADPFYRVMTVQQLLDHTAGLLPGAPGTGELGRILGLNRPATLSECVAYMWTQSLFVPPGTFSYSNWGYQLLGAIIEKVSGISYDQFIKTHIAQPIGASSFAVGTTSGNAPREIWYAGQWFSIPETSVTGADPEVEQPYAMDMTTRPAAGSLICSATDYMRFLKNYFQDGNRKPDNLQGYTWSYEFYGSLPGTLTLTHDTISPDGSSLSYAVFVNERIDGRDYMPGDLSDSLLHFFRGFTAWPATDLFVHTPFNGPHTIADGAELQVEDFDSDGEGVAYHDADAGNNGGQYRNTGVDIEICGTGGYDVGWTNTGEWLNYTCTVAAGNYNIGLNTASLNAGGIARLYQDEFLIATFTLPTTGGWQTYKTTTANNVVLSGGAGSVLRLEITAGGSNFNKITFAKVSAPNTPPTVAVAASSNPNPVIGATANLSVLGADDGGEANLTYTWTVTGTPPAAVAFSVNGTNAAKHTVATFTKSGTYGILVTIKDAGNQTVSSSVTVTVTIPPTPGRLVIKSATASSVENASFPASNAIDGSLVTRWSSAWTDNEWITFDLGAQFTVARVVFVWETASSQNYKVQGSNVPAFSGTPVQLYNKTVSSPCGARTDSLTIGTGTASCRYVRMLGVKRCTTYGYSIFDARIYGY